MHVLKPHGTHSALEFRFKSHPFTRHVGAQGEEVLAPHSQSLAQDGVSGQHHGPAWTHWTRGWVDSESSSGRNENRTFYLKTAIDAHSRDSLPGNLSTGHIADFTTHTSNIYTRYQLFLAEC